MEILWDADRPLSKPEVMAEAVTDKGEPLISMSTFHVLVNSLLEKGYIVVVGGTKKHTRRFAPNVTRQEHHALQIVSTESYSPEDIPSIVASLFKYSKVSDPKAMLAEIEKLARKGKE